MKIISGSRWWAVSRPFYPRTSQAPHHRYQVQRGAYSWMPVCLQNSRYKCPHHFFVNLKVSSYASANLFSGKVSVALHHLELFPVNKKANFQIHVETEENAELAVSIAGPRNDLPVQVTYLPLWECFLKLWKNINLTKIFSRLVKKYVSSDKNLSTVTVILWSNIEGLRSPIVKVFFAGNRKCQKRVFSRISARGSRSTCYQCWI